MLACCTLVKIIQFYWLNAAVVQLNLKHRDLSNTPPPPPPPDQEDSFTPAFFRGRGSNKEES